MRRGEDLPVSRFPTLLALLVAVIALVMVLAATLGWAG
jgi:putative membrane protein